MLVENSRRGDRWRSYESWCVSPQEVEEGQTCSELKDQRSARAEYGPVPREVDSYCGRYRPSERPTEGYDRPPRRRDREDAPQHGGLRCSYSCSNDQSAQEKRLHGRVVPQEHLAERHPEGHAGGGRGYPER